MSRLVTARERLERAVSRLEGVVAGRAVGDGAAAAGGTVMAEELAAVRDAYAALESRNREVSDRLDRAIFTLRSVVEG